MSRKANSSSRHISLCWITVFPASAMSTHCGPVTPCNRASQNYIIICRVYGAKSLPEQTRTCCCFDPQQQTSIKWESKYLSISQQNVFQNIICKTSDNSDLILLTIQQVCVVKVEWILWMHISREKAYRYRFIVVILCWGPASVGHCFRQGFAFQTNTKSSFIRCSSQQCMFCHYQ